MTYRWPPVSAGAVAALAFALACGASNPGTPLPDGGAASIQFDQSGVLTLAPADTAVIDLSGMGVRNVTLSLAGNYLDAFLDAGTVDLSSGQGQVTLHAPSSPTTFSLLASSGAASARLDVAVSATGFANVLVTVDYHGKRAAPIVAASAFVETTCQQVGTKAIDGAPLQVETFGDPILLQSVPTDGQIAIKVRIAHYATGCFDVPSLTPGATRDVTVDVFDLPLDLADSTLETRFTFAPDPADAQALEGYFEQVVDGAVLNASFTGSADEPSHLLDAMGAASGNATAFASARTQKGWDSTTTSWLSQHLPSMHDRAATWLQGAAQAGVGDLTGRLDGDAAKPVFTPHALGQLDATAAGITAPLPFVWTGLANDVLSISGMVDAVPSELACAGADARARADVPQSSGVADALQGAIDCSGLGDSLAQNGYAFGTCDGTCMSALCTTAIANLWSAGAAALSKTSDALLLSLSVAAPADVSDTPQVQSYAGTWVGAFAYGTSQVATKGLAKGAYGTIPN